MHIFHTAELSQVYLHFLQNLYITKSIKFIERSSGLYYSTMVQENPVSEEETAYTSTLTTNAARSCDMLVTTQHITQYYKGPQYESSAP
jgi:hypothetical protein